MKLRNSIYVLVIVILPVKCSEPGSSSAAPVTVQNTKAVVLSKPGSSFNDSLLIDGACAVFYEPNARQREKIKSVTPTSVFEATIHDFFYQQKYARTYLETQWPRLKILKCNSARFLVFKRKSGPILCIDLNRAGDSYGLIVFDGTRRPQQIDMTNIDTQVPAYFKTY